MIASATLGRSVDEILRMTDLGLAESALASPSAGFGGEELYPDLTSKAAVLEE